MENCTIINAELENVIIFSGATVKNCKFNDKIIGYKNVIIWKCFLELFFLLWATMLFKHIWAKILKELFDKFDLFDTDLSTISWGLASWGITLGILIGTDRIKLLFNAIMYNIFRVM